VCTYVHIYIYIYIHIYIYIYVYTHTYISGSKNEMIFNQIHFDNFDFSMSSVQLFEIYVFALKFVCS